MLKYVFKLSTEANILEHAILVLTSQVQLCRDVGKGCENSFNFFLRKAEGSGRRGSCSALPVASRKRCEVAPLCLPISSSHHKGPSCEGLFKMFCAEGI